MDNQIIDDILTTAFEGGINYWCTKVSVRDGDFKGADYASMSVSKGATVDLTVDESDGAVDVKPLTRESIIHGINEASKFKKQTIDAFYEDHDAESADMAVQFAVFGKLIFG
jgi:hypothetical protein